MTKAYYNEYDKNAAAWLRELIKNGLIADGVVDERSIIDVQADELVGFTQHHFFAGIGGWSLALRMAGHSDDAPVWTASLPCQPFSVAGLGKGTDDERHLLPHFLELVRQRKPDRIFGEQVEGAIRHGWLDDLQTTMEAEGYAVGHCVLGAHSVGSFHQRQRLYWVADSNQSRLERRERTERTDQQPIRSHMLVSGMADAENTDWRRDEEAGRSDIWTDPEWIYCRDGKYRPIKRGIEPCVIKVADGVSGNVGCGSDPSQPINANETQEARVMRLKGYGNAIVPQVAAEFIAAFMDIA